MITLSVLYLINTCIFTGLMILLSPPLAGFTSWTAVMLVWIVGTLFFLFTLTEFLNIADKFETFSNTKLEQRLFMANSLQVLAPSSAKNLNGGSSAALSSIAVQESMIQNNKNRKLRMQSLVVSDGVESDYSPASPSGKGGFSKFRSTAAGGSPAKPGTAKGLDPSSPPMHIGYNPLYEHERMMLAGARVPPPPPGLSARPTLAASTGPANMSEHDMMRLMASPSPTAPIRKKQAESMALAAQDLQRKVNRLSVVRSMDENDIIETLKRADEQQKFVALGAREMNQLKRRISKRLAARGVQGEAAKELTSRIAEYQAMKIALDRQQNRRRTQQFNAPPRSTAFSSMSSVPFGSPPGASAMSNFTTTSSSNINTSQVDDRKALTMAASPTASKAKQMQTLAELKRGEAYPSQLQLGSPTSPSRTLGSPKAPTSPTFSASRSPPPPLPPQVNLNLTQASKQDLENANSPRPARVQATERTTDAQMDDFFLRQFDPAREGELLQPFDGDDSFWGFLKEVATQITIILKNDIKSFVQRLRQCGSCFRGEKGEDEDNEDEDTTMTGKAQGTVGTDEPTTASHGKKEPIMKDNPLQFEMNDDAQREQVAKERFFQSVRVQKKQQQQLRRMRRVSVEDEFGPSSSKPNRLQKQYLGYMFNRIRSRSARFLNERVRPFFASLINVVRENKENEDPATYGLRIPGRRLLFIQGLLFMFILLVYTSRNRVTSEKLKDAALRFAISAANLSIDTSVAYNWPGVANVSTTLDVPLQAYVDRSTDAYNIMWVVFFFWLLSFIAEIVYANFGRDMEEKRKGIRLARNISFLNLPLLLVAVILPCAPDYVGLSLNGVENIIPECAPRLSATVLGVVSNLFGVLAGAYLSFQTMVVLLLIVPSIARALFFVLAREILDLHRLSLFEPRKDYRMTRKRLESARFVWNVYPLLSPVLTYLPLVLICQLLGKLYVSILSLTFLVGPIVFAQFRWRRRMEDETVTEWLVFSTGWILYYVATLSLIVLIESLQRNQVAFVLRNTFESWTWYMKIAAEICLAIVVTSDMLYQFMASDAELEADTVINEYFEALEDQAQQMVIAEHARQLAGDGSDSRSKASGSHHDSDYSPRNVASSGWNSDGGGDAASTVAPLPRILTLEERQKFRMQRRFEHIDV